MPISILQERQTSSGATVTSISLAFSSSVTAGSSLHTAGTSNATSSFTCADSVNGSHSALGTNLFDAPGNISVAQFAKNSSAPGTVTVTVSFPSSGFPGIWIKEVGVTSGLDGTAFNAQLQTTGTTRSSGNCTPSVQPGLISGFCVECTNPATLGTGGGFTAGAASPGWDFGGGFGGSFAVSESQRYTSTSTLAATFTETTSADHTIALAACFVEASSAVAPTIPSSFLGWAANMWQAAVDLFPNLLLTTLAVVAMPPGDQLFASAPIVNQTVSCEQAANRLTLLSPSVLPFGAQKLSASAPQVKYQAPPDVFRRPLTLGIQAATPIPLPLSAQRLVASAPQIKYQLQLDVYRKPLTLGIPAAAILPAGSAISYSAPAIRYPLQSDIYLYPLTLVPAVVSLPLSAQTVDASAPSIKAQLQLDVYQYPLTLGIPFQLLPQGAQIVDASAPSTKYSPQVDAYPYPLTLGISSAGTGPPLPLSSITWDHSAPASSYSVQSDVCQRPLTLGIPAAVALLPLGAQTVDASAPAVWYRPQADFYANRLPLLPVLAPFFPLDTSQLQRKYAVQTEQPPRPLTLGIAPPPPGPRPLQLSASAPITKYAVYSLMFPTTIYLPSNTELPALTFYGFESPLAFMLDFDVMVSFGGIVAPALLSEPGEDILGGHIESNQYEIEYITSQLTLSFGDEVIIQDTTFTVLEVTAADDGVFTRARLEGSPFVNQSYIFETPDAFLTDFATEAVVLLSSQSAEVIMSQPGQNLMGNRISSNQYEIEYATVELTLSYGVLLTIRGDVYKVIQTYPLDDGVFSRAKLETT